MSLFPNAMKMLQAYTAREYSDSLFGQFLGDVADYQSQAGYFSSVPQVIDKYVRRGRYDLFNQFEQMPFFAFTSDILKYARTGPPSPNILNFLSDLGPMGQFIRGMINADPTSHALKQQLQIAANFIRAFGGKVTFPWSTSIDDFSWTIESARDFLEQAGYDVTERDNSRLPTDRGGYDPFIPTDSTPPAPGVSPIPSPLRPGEPGWSPSDVMPMTPGVPGMPADPGSSLVPGAPVPPWPGGSQNPESNKPWFSGETVNVKSQTVHSISYDHRTGNLYVRYSYYGPGQFWENRPGSSTPGPVYKYENVTVEQAKSLFTAPYKGTWIWDNIRIRGTWSGHRNPYELVAVERGYVPRRSVMGEGREYWVPRTNVLAKSPSFQSLKFAVAFPASPPTGEYLDRGAPYRGDPDRGW